MPDFGAMTIPAFVGVFSMGWGACYAQLYLPLKARLEKAESRMDKIEAANAAELAALRQKLMK